MIYNLRMNKNTISVLIFVNLIVGCAFFAPQTENSKLDNKPIAIRRKIKDIDYRAATDDRSMKKRLVESITINFSD